MGELCFKPSEMTASRRRVMDAAQRAARSHEDILRQGGAVRFYVSKPLRAVPWPGDATPDRESVPVGQVRAAGRIRYLDGTEANLTEFAYDGDVFFIADDGPCFVRDQSQEGNE